MNSESTCYACELSADLIGGRIFETACWLVEHCMGPLGLGTLIVKLRRHEGIMPEPRRVEAFCRRAAAAFAEDV